VGSRHEQKGRSGFAHLFEHLMFGGSKNTADKDYNQWFEDIGGETNASTSVDHTDYHAAVPPSALARAIWLEADRMAYPLAKLDEQGFAHERDVVKNEWREHYEDAPLGNLRAIAHEEIYGLAHPYGTMTIGRGDELDKATLPEARELVQRYFGTIPAGTVPRARIVSAPTLAKERRVAVRADVTGPAVAMAWPAPATHEDGFEELHYGIRFFSLRLRERLVREKKIANSVSVNYESARLGGLVMLTVKLKPGASADTTISVIDEYLAQAARLGRLNTWDNFGNFKTNALVGEVTSLEGLKGRAVRILHDLEFHGAVNSVKKDLQRLQSVDAADVGAAVDHFLVDSPRVVMVVTPTPGAPHAGKKVSP
jgi:zinc protease